MRTAILLVLLFASGCSGDSAGEVPVTGTVTLDERPLVGAAVMFRPTGTTPGNGGSALTAEEGLFTLSGPQGQKGIAPGEYKVTVSLRLKRDGTPLPPDTPPIEADATESLPPKYSDPERTELLVTVEANKPVTIALKGKK